MSALLTAAAIEIGKAVTKSIFKFWMKDSVLGDDISSSLIDLLASRTSDTLVHRKGVRQFDDIGDKISADMFPLLKSENISLDEGDRRAVASAVAETINKSRLSAELLLKQNLQPTQLEQYMLATNPNVTRDFSEAATSLYQRILSESCTYIIDISSQLPSFTEHTFAEVLKREDLISAKTDRVLEELHEIRKQLDPTDEVDRFEIDYRDAVARNLDVLQLIGADVSLPNRRYKLSMAYITLSVTQKPPISPPIMQASTEGSEDEPTQDILLVDAALASSSRLIIRGLAGSGKTTLLQWIAVRAATRSFEGPLTEWNECIPFYIRLRQYSHSQLPKPEAFLDFAAPAIAGTMPDKWVHHMLRSGRAIVLVDGVDEVSATQREEVHTWLRDLIETYKDVRFIITSRPHAIEEGWMNHEAFSDAILQEMELADIFLFINHWHESIKHELLIADEKNELDPLAERLKERVRHSHAVRNLATNPLLCAMLCALNRERRQQLPVNRIELYEACCSLLLERREKESRIDLSDYPTLNYSQKRRLLDDLAYWMTTENLAEAEKSVVDDRFERKLANMMNTSSDITGKAVSKLLVERSGIIREPITGQIDFTHRTFQEYFAAQQVVAAMGIEQLVANAHNDQWREVIILAAGLATSKALCEQLVNRLIKRGDEEKVHHYQLHLIAVSCLETAIELGPEVRAEVEKRLSQLVPPKNMTDAKALAAAGELAVKHLGKKQKLKASICAACIRTLANIGSDAALEMLEEYADDQRQTVINELISAWDDFDGETYAKHVLSKTFKNRYVLRLSNVPSQESLQFLISLTNLRELELSYCSQLTDLTPLAALTSLTSLKLHSCSQLIDLTPLAASISLSELDLSGCSQLTDLTPLAASTSLTSLNLQGFDQLNTLGLAALTSLTSLNLIYCSQLTDLTPLAALTSLSKLDLQGCTQLADLTPLAGLTNLTWLNLRGCSQLTDPTPLAALTNLTFLRLPKDVNELTIPKKIKE